MTLKVSGYKVRSQLYARVMEYTAINKIAKMYIFSQASNLCVSLVNFVAFVVKIVNIIFKRIVQQHVCRLQDVIHDISYICSKIIIWEVINRNRINIFRLAIFTALLLLTMC